MKAETRAFLRIEKMTKGKVEGYEQWDEIPLSTDAVLLGRPSRTSDIIQPNIRIVGDDYISRNQAEIYYSFSDGCYMVRDLGSMNGTFINGEQLEKGRAYPLKDHDLIGLAKVSGEMKVILRFRASEVTLPPWADEEPGKPLSKDGLSIHLGARRVFVAGKEIPLTRTEFKVIEVLYSNRGNACSIDSISWEVWGQEGASNELVAKYISRLREKIEQDSSKPRYIITVPGRQGYYRISL